MSDNFPTLSANPAAREAFAKNCIDILTYHDFDGIDIDWEVSSFTTEKTHCLELLILPSLDVSFIFPRNVRTKNKYSTPVTPNIVACPRTRKTSLKCSQPSSSTWKC